MFPRHRHTPMFDPERKRCPVCHHAVYSPAGIHPQCAERLADPPRPKKAKDVPGQVEQATDDGADAIVELPTSESISAHVRPPAHTSSSVVAADRAPLRATTVKGR